MVIESGVLSEKTRDKVQMKVLLCTFGTTIHYACRIFYSLLQDITKVKLFFFNHQWDAQTEDFVNEYIRKEKPDLIAVSIITSEMELCKKFVDTVRRLRNSQDTKIIFGGPHAFLAPEDCLEISDFICTGEGEYTLLGLCEEFKKTGVWASAELLRIPNLAYREDGHTKQSDVQDFYYTRQFIDGLPFPAYGEDDIYVYDGISWQNDTAVENGSYSAFSSRGCPNRCTYCINSVFKTRKVTMRSPEKVIEELVRVKTRFPRLKRVQFVDEVFCWQEKWVNEFAALYKEKVSLPFECDSFPGRHSESTIEILAKSGLYKVSIGVQSCSQKILDDIYHRPQKVSDVIRDNKIYIKNKVLPTYDFIVDNPFETPEDLLETVETVRKLGRPNFFRVYSLYFFPRHTLTERAKREGLYHGEDDMLGSYYKITTTHTGDQNSQKPWYADPHRAIREGDRKVALNWLLVFYGALTIPKRLVDFAFGEYKKNRTFWIIILAYYYKMFDYLYKICERLGFLIRKYRHNGALRTFRYVLGKIKKT